MSEQVATILTNGRIWRGAEEGFCEAVALGGGKVLACGSRDEIDALAGPETETVDLEGRLAVPGFYDAHMHLHSYGLAMEQVDLRPSAIGTLQGFLDAISAQAKALGPGAWVLGRGYDESKLDVGRHPLRTELDAAAPENPVYVVRTDGHVAVANSRALELAGITADTPSPFGGLIEKKDGELTGLLAENGREKLAAVLPKKSREDFVRAIENGGRDLLSYGITSCMEAAVGIHDGYIELEAYLEARRTGRLPLRVYACLMGDKERTIIDRAAAEGHVTGTGDDMLRIGPVKIFTDGSAGGRTAAMSKPYEGTDDTGLLCLTDEECDALVAKAHGLGYQLAIHAIGDAAIGQVLSAYEKALAAEPDPDRRHRIEHCGWLTDAQLEKMRTLGVLPASQLSFLYWFGDLYRKVLGPERTAASHPMRKWIDAGLHPSGSTDCPVTEIDPMPGIYAMVTRKSQGGAVMGPDQALSMAEALHAYTSESAYASKEEAIKGKLVPGMLGDVAVLSRDLFECDPEEILTTRCEMTVLGGKIVHDRGLSRLRERAEA